MEQKNTISKDIYILEAIFLKSKKYLNHELPLSSLVIYLDSFFRPLKNVDNPWADKCMKLCLDLEVCYAMSFVDNEFKDLSKEDTQIVEDSLHEISNLVEEKMQELKAAISTPDKLACRVCGKLQSDLPWGEDGKTPTFEVCYCCGVQFGYEDGNEESMRKFRQAWLEQGANWFVPEEKPKSWVLEEQMKNIPEQYR